MELETALMTACGALASAVAALAKAYVDRGRDCTRERETMAAEIDKRWNDARTAIEEQHAARIDDLKAQLAREQRTNEAWDDLLRERAASKLGSGVHTVRPQ